MDLILAAAGSAPLLGGLSKSSLMIMWVGLAIYFVILLGIGVWSGKQIKDMKDFLVAGRRLPLWMATGTLIAHIYPLSKRNVIKVWPPERIVKYDEWAKAWKGISAAPMQISEVAIERTESVVL